jgi:phosphatidylglycerophosphate synthase
VKFVSKRIPILLIYSRLVLAGVMMLLSWQQPVHYRITLVILLVAGILTDVFDGIIARRLKVSTQKLRRLDSSVDQVFWLSALGCAFAVCPDFFRSHYPQLLTILGLEALTYGISYFRFRKEVATHAIASKFWTLSILASLIQIILYGHSETLFALCFWLGVLTRMEIILILLVLRKWTNDVPSLWHALRLRRGLDIKRHKLFNG